MSQAAIDALAAHLGADLIATHAHRGDDTAIIARERIHDACAFLRDDPALAFDMLVDITATDYLGEEPRFEVVYHLHSLKKHHRVRLKARVPEDDPVIDTVTDLWRVANWLEREVWDMFGIRFRGHPDLRRILLYDEFVGHPLRKDYPKDGRQPLVRRPPEEIEAALAARNARAAAPGTGPKPGSPPEGVAGRRDLLAD